MSPERAAEIEKALQGLGETVPGFRDAWNNIIAEMEDMDSLLQLPKSMGQHMGGPFKGERLANRRRLLRRRPRNGLNPFDVVQ